MHFDPSELSVEEDPYPLFRELRARHPVFHTDHQGMWVVT